MRIRTPCISVCEVNGNTGYCEGCFRTIEEITDWINYSDDKRLDIMEECLRREEE